MEKSNSNLILDSNTWAQTKSAVFPHIFLLIVGEKSVESRGTDLVDMKLHLQPILLLLPFEIQN